MRCFAIVLVYILRPQNVCNNYLLFTLFVANKILFLLKVYKTAVLIEWKVRHKCSNYYDNWLLVFIPPKEGIKFLSCPSVILSKK